MGYACPVCGTPQADAEHLANHLAFTALLRGDEHEAWLDERVPDWGDRDPASLAEAVAGDAPEAEFPQVFEDTTDDHADHGHGVEDELARHGGYGRDSIGAEERRIVEEARELTRQMRGDETNGDGDAEPRTDPESETE